MVLVGLLDVHLQLRPQRRFSELFARNLRDQVAVASDATVAAARSLQQPPALGGRVISLGDLRR